MQSKWVNVQSLYRSYGETVRDNGVYFGKHQVHTIRQLDLRRYRLLFSPDDKTGMLVLASLQLEVRNDHA